MSAAVVACRRQAAKVPFTAVVVRRHARAVEESEQLITVLEQPPSDAQTLGMTTAALQEEIVETIQDRSVSPVKGFASLLVAVLRQLDGVPEPR